VALIADAMTTIRAMAAGRAVAEEVASTTFQRPTNIRTFSALMKRLSKASSFVLLASILVFFLAGSSAPTPLYPMYQAEWGFSPITVTIVFGSYALAVLASLLVVGSLSDYVGRRPVLLVAVLLQAVTMTIFATARGVEALVVARVVQGIGTGGAAGAAGAGMLDLDRDRGTLTNSVAPMLGTATGAALSGILVQFLPWPTKLVYVVLGFVFAAQALGVLMMPETMSPRPGALASLRPHLRVPPRLRSAVLVAAPALVGVWALAGFYGSLGPSLVRRLVASNAPALSGLALFAIAATGMLTALLSRKRPPLTTMAGGAAALAIGVGATIVAIHGGWLAGFFLGTAVAGAGFGAGFQGAIRSVLSLTAARERAGVLSVLYVIAYLAMGLPAVFAGFRVVHGGGILTTAREYGVVVIVLAILALGGALLRRRTQQAPSEAAARGPLSVLATNAPAPLNDTESLNIRRA